MYLLKQLKWSGKPIKDLLYMSVWTDFIYCMLFLSNKYYNVKITKKENCIAFSKQRLQQGKQRKQRKKKYAERKKEE